MMLELGTDDVARLLTLYRLAQQSISVGLRKCPAIASEFRAASPFDASFVGSSRELVSRFLFFCLRLLHSSLTIRHISKPARPNLAALSPPVELIEPTKDARRTMPKVHLLDYVAGNIRSLVNAIEKLGYEVDWVRSPEDVPRAEVSLAIASWPRQDGKEDVKNAEHVFRDLFFPVSATLAIACPNYLKQAICLPSKSTLTRENPSWVYASVCRPSSRDQLKMQVSRVSV